MTAALALNIIATLILLGVAASEERDSRQRRQHEDVKVPWASRLVAGVFYGVLAAAIWL